MGNLHSKKTPCQSPLRPCGFPCKLYSEPTLIYSPSHGGLGNTLISLVSFVVLANVTKRKVVLQWDRGVGIGAQASYRDMFTGGAFKTAMLQGHRCDPHIAPQCILEFTAKRWDHVQRFAKGAVIARLHACPTVWATGNAYFAPLLGAPPSLQFGALSHHLFVPKEQLVQAADRFVFEQTRGHADALIALHVRESHLSGKANQTTRKWSFQGTNPWRTSGKFIRCVEKVRSLAHAAGYAKSRVYIAADQRGVRERAKQLIGSAVLAPAHCGSSCANGKTELPNDIGLAPSRSPAATVLALKELLVLARSDALLVWNLQYSTFSAVAAAWATHGAGGQKLPIARPRLGVFLVGRGGNCSRMADRVEPPVYQKPKRSARSRPVTR